MSERQIKRALISVFNKEGLEPIVRELAALGVELISTGGTQTYITGSVSYTHLDVYKRQGQANRQWHIGDH